MESSKKDKSIIIKTSIINNQIRIEILDSGIGVLPENKNKMFTYGFTTKKTGHGFGLHTAALIVNELGGSLSVESEGMEKGTKFFLDIPYRTQ